MRIWPPNTDSCTCTPCSPRRRRRGRCGWSMSWSGCCPRSSACPATAAMAGYEAISIAHDRQTGELDLADFQAKLDDDCAAIMMTVPNTLGLFETQIVEICRLAHDVGCYVYCDGANLNALVGQVRPGDLGVDLLHVNLHKTFAVPHGGGGPGGGAICVAAALEPYLPAPLVVRRA